MKQALIFACICVLALYSGGIRAAERAPEKPGNAKPSPEVVGFVQRADGQAFAYLKEIGLVSEGDVIDYKWKDDVYRLRILTITKDQMKVEVLGVKDRPPPPKRRRVSPRDPFWPVGYEAWEVVEEG